MSHFTEVKTRLTDATILKKALTRMGMTIEEAAQGVPVRGFMGDSLHADFKVLTKTHYDVGFRKNGETFEIVGDWELLPKVSGIEQSEFTQAVSRAYAREAIEQLAKAQGYEISCRESETSQQIEMVVTQW